MQPIYHILEKSTYVALMVIQLYDCNYNGYMISLVQILQEEPHSLLTHTERSRHASL